MKKISIMCKNMVLVLVQFSLYHQGGRLPPCILQNYSLLYRPCTHCAHSIKLKLINTAIQAIAMPLPMEPCSNCRQFVRVLHCNNERGMGATNNGKLTVKPHPLVSFHLTHPYLLFDIHHISNYFGGIDV